MVFLPHTDWMIDALYRMSRDGGKISKLSHGRLHLAPLTRLLLPPRHAPCQANQHEAYRSRDFGWPISEREILDVMSRVPI